MASLSWASTILGAPSRACCRSCVSFVLRALAHAVRSLPVVSPRRARFCYLALPVAGQVHLQVHPFLAV